MRRWLVSAAFLALAGCAATSQQTADRAYPLYQGKPIGSLIDRWGPPEGSVPGDDGGATYIWRDAQPYGTGDTGLAAGSVGSAPVAMAIPDIAATSSACRVAVKVDPTNRILSWRFYGPNNTCTGMMQRLV